MKIEKLKFKIETPKSRIKKLNSWLSKLAVTCYQANAPEDPDKFIDMIMNNDHTGVLEHELITIKLNADIGLGRQMTRQRMSSFLQESTRYCNYVKDKFGSQISIIDPIDAIMNHKKMSKLPKKEIKLIRDKILKSHRRAEVEYMGLISIGVPAEIAREVLPLGTRSELIVTANIRQWLWILHLRADKHAHPAIRYISQKIEDEFKKLMPVIFDRPKQLDLRKILSDGKTDVSNDTWTIKEYGIEIFSSNTTHIPIGLFIIEQDDKYTHVRMIKHALLLDNSKRIKDV